MGTVGELILKFKNVERICSVRAVKVDSQHLVECGRASKLDRERILHIDDPFTLKVSTNKRKRILRWENFVFIGSY